MSADDDIDEVALNVLLAEGIDLPTALAASRWDSGTATDPRSCFGTVILLVVVVVAAIGLLIF